MKLMYKLTLQSREVNTFLGDVIRHMSPGRTFEQYYPQLQNIVDKVLNHTQDFESLFTMVTKNNFRFFLKICYRYYSYCETLMPKKNLTVKTIHVIQ